MAVIGVSLTNERNPANVIYTKNQLRYPVRTFPVNPKGGSLLGEKVFKRVSDIPDRLDLAVIAVKAQFIPQVLRECIDAGVSGAVIVSGGFAEVGRHDLQESIASIAKTARLPIIGPNCLGIYCPGTADSFFLPSERMVRPQEGDVALVSQSGGILVDHMIKFAEEGVGLSLAVSIGNKALIREVDLLRYLSRDERTRVIAFYIEGFKEGEGREFLAAAADCPKPVVVLKAGRSPEGTRAVSSHTASLAGDYEVFTRGVVQAGITVAGDDLEFISFCESLSCYQGPSGGRVGIITGSGGHGAMAVDACFAHGISVPQIPRDLQERIRRDLSPSIREIAAIGNPVDVTGSAVDDDFVAVARHMARMKEIDSVLTLLLPYLPGITSNLGAMLSNLFRREGKPLFAYVPHVDKYKMLIEGFELNRVPVSPSIAGVVLMAKAIKRNR
jgi:acetyltransferase